MAPYNFCKPTQIFSKFNLDVTYVGFTSVNLIFLFLLYKKYKNGVESHLLTFLIVILIFVNISASVWQYANNVFQT